MGKKYKFALVGATGLVGRIALSILEEKNLPISEYHFFASSKSAGKDIIFMNNSYKVEELNDSSFNSIFDFAIFSAGSDTAKHFAPIAVSNNCVVIDNSSAFRMEKDVPLVVPEINMSDAFNNKGIISNPNCSTIQAVVALKPLDNKYHIKRIVYSTYQAVSGAGMNGIRDLENGIKKISPTKFPHDIFNNCLPHIDSFENNGYTKEEIKMIEETKKILHRPDLHITATTVRVPVFNCHSESVNVEFYNDFNLDELRDTLENAPGIIVQDDPSNNLYPLASNCSGKDSVFIGRIRRDYSVKSAVNLWIVADNVRKGAATNAIQILEGLINEKNSI